MLSIEKNENNWIVKGPMTLNQIESVLQTEHAFLVDSRLTIDLSGVTEVDTTALSLMMEWLRRAQANKTTIIFAHLPENLQQLANLYQVADIIHATN